MTTLEANFKDQTLTTNIDKNYTHAWLVIAIRDTEIEYASGWSASEVNATKAAKTFAKRFKNATFEVVSVEEK